MVARSAALRAPAAWAFVALAALLLAVAPRAAAGAAWAVLAAFVLLEFVVEFRLVAASVLWVSPFAQVPQLPDGPGHAAAGLALLAGTGLLLVVACRMVRSGDLR